MSELVTKDDLKAALHISTMRFGLMIGVTFFGLFVALVLVLAGRSSLREAGYSGKGSQMFGGR
jgi:hypothetical protein